MLPDLISKLNISNSFSYTNKQPIMKNISFGASMRDEFIRTQGSKISNNVYDNGTLLRNNIENCALEFYGIDYELPVALSNVAYHNLGNLGFWQIIENADELREKTIEAKKTYPDEKLLPIAKSSIDKSMVYLNAQNSEIIVKNNNETIASYDDFSKWYLTAVSQLFESDEFTSECDDDCIEAQKQLKETYYNDFDFPKNYKQAKSLNLTRFMNNWSIPENPDSIINYSTAAVVPFAQSESGTTFAAFVNNNTNDSNVIIATIMPSDRKEFAATRNDKLWHILEHFENFEDWFKNELNTLFEAETY